MTRAMHLDLAHTFWREGDSRDACNDAGELYAIGDWWANRQADLWVMGLLKDLMRMRRGNG